MSHLQLNRCAGFRRGDNAPELRRPMPKCLAVRRLVEFGSGGRTNLNTEPSARPINRYAVLARDALS